MVLAKHSHRVGFSACGAAASSKAHAWRCLEIKIQFPADFADSPRARSHAIVDDLLALNPRAVTGLIHLPS